MSSVLQPWVQELPWKMQSVLLSALRGPDNVDATECKKFTRWFRSTTQENADPDHTYMAGNETPIIDFDKLAHELEYGCTWHYLGHLIHALEIIAYHGHPLGSLTTRSRFALKWYGDLVTWMHLHHEPKEEMDERLRDVVEHD